MTRRSVKQSLDELLKTLDQYPNPSDKVSKKAQKAYFLANQSNLAQWRRSIRHPRFRKELGQLQQECRNEKDEIAVHEKIKQLFDKWDLPRLTPRLLMNLPPIDQARCTDYLENFLSCFEGNSGPPMGASPVDVLNHLSEDYPEYVVLRVRCHDHPVGELLGIIQDILARTTKKPVSYRRRLDKAKFQFQVFDLAGEAMPFDEIARQLGRSQSTIKSAYVVASKNILGERIQKKKAAIINYEPQTHIRKCPVCKKAKTAEHLCPKTFAYIHQGHKSQKELTGYKETGPKQNSPWS